MPISRDSSIKVLAPVPCDKNGWPWTEEMDATVYTDEIHWPKISIITPSFNQGQFIEETIRSVLLQNYPNLEYIIIDGGSKDNSVDIIKKYEKWISYWVSEKDRGQSEAINKGFNRCTGDIIYWLNSDDYLKQNALYRVAKCFLKGCKILIGRVELIDGNNQYLQLLNGNRISHLSLLRQWEPYFIPAQPGIFFARSLINTPRLVRDDLQFVMDYELWLRISDKAEFKRIKDPLGVYRIHNLSKSGLSDNFKSFEPEWYKVGLEYYSQLNSYRRFLLKSQKIFYPVKREVLRLFK